MIGSEGEKTAREERIMRLKKTAVAIGILLLIATAAAGHPPSSMEIEYSQDDGVISIGIVHPVGDVSTHFIESVTVSVDGNTVADLVYLEQWDKGGEKIVVTIGRFGPGSKISVKAVCNKIGTLEKTLDL
jgi:hypothetical protein